MRRRKKAGPEGRGKGRTCAPPSHTPVFSTPVRGHQTRPAAAPPAAQLRPGSSTYLGPGPRSHCSGPLPSGHPARSGPCRPGSQHLPPGAPRNSHSPRDTSPLTPRRLRGPPQTHVHDDKDPTKSPSVPRCLLELFTHRPPRPTQVRQTSAPLSRGDTGTPQSSLPEPPGPSRHARGAHPRRGRSPPHLGVGVRGAPPEARQEDRPDRPPPPADGGAVLCLNLAAAPRRRERPSRHPAQDRPSDLPAPCPRGDLALLQACLGTSGAWGRLGCG